MGTTRKPNIQTKMIPVPEIAAEMDINLIAAYNLTRQAGFPAIRVGKRILVPRLAFEEWLSKAASAHESYTGKNF